MSKIVFISGTDTSAGKTLLTALLLHHLRQSGVRALAMKPFCSGSLDDVRLLQSLQRGEIENDLMNPFYFAEPVAPLVAARKHRREVSLMDVLEAIRKVRVRCDVLLIEGCGGLLVPLSKDLSLADLIRKFRCSVLISARNKLGVINHSLLTILNLQKAGIKRVSVILMEVKKRDISAQSNLKLLNELLGRIPIFGIPFLGENATTESAVKKSAKKINKTLAEITEFVTFAQLFTRTSTAVEQNKKSFDNPKREK